jgi:hypothetical protein
MGDVPTVIVGRTLGHEGGGVEEQIGARGHFQGWRSRSDFAHNADEARFIGL